MAIQSLDLGTSADDGTGDSLRVGGDKINDNFLELYTLLGNGSILTTGLSVSGATITLSEAVGTFTTITPNSADSASLGTAALGWSDLYLYDSSVIYFGIDSDITLTHVPDVGLRLKSAATADDKPIVLTLQTGETDIAASDVLGKIEFQAPDEGTGTDAILVAAHIAAISEGNFSASNNATKLSFATGASEAAAEKMSLSSAGLLTVSGRIITDDTTAATSTTDGSLQTDGGLSVAADAVIGDDLLLLSDAAVLSFGANSEVTLTHVHNDGLLLNTDMQLQFRDSAINIRSDADGDLDINADDEIELNSTLIDINGNVQISGTLAQADAITIATDKKIIFRDAAIHISSTADGDLSIAADDEIDITSTLIDINGNVEISGTATTTGVHTFTAVPVFPNNTVESADIQADAITGAKIADDAIDSEHYTDGSIDTAHIADNQVTLAKMAGGTDGNIISYDASGDPVAIATGSDGQVLTSTGAGSPPAFEAVPGEFASGTDMVFHQTSAPTGWTKNTTAALNDGALRTTTGTVGTGGTVAFETAFASQAVAGSNGNTTATTLSIAQIPAHTHTSQLPTANGAAGNSSGSPVTDVIAVATSSTGGGGSHLHGGSTFSGTAIDLNVKFYDVIIAAKD